MTTARHIGVLLAAGRGSRMGATKQLLPWPPSPKPPPPEGDDSAFDDSPATSTQPAATVVSTSFDLIAPHCAHMIVVLGHDAPAVCEALVPRAFTAVISDPQSEMLHSIRIGLVEAQRIGEGSPVLLHPADCPAVNPQTVQAVLSTAASTNRAVMPEHNGNGGHPVAIPAALIHNIVTWQGEGGLRAYWQEHADHAMRLAVQDVAVTRDLDTPDDYNRG